jgi:hypothetical protein
VSFAKSQEVIGKKTTEWHNVDVAKFRNEIMPAGSP